jgi:Lycopene cyclase
VSPDYPYVWLIWSSAFLVPWALVYVRAPSRPRMLRVSAATSLLGLTEPIFVPRYWNPPSLFDLASRTGFDLESLVFCFAIGGIGSVLYDTLTRHEPAPMPRRERNFARHRLHAAALATPFVAFPMLYALPWNPIYPGIAALALGSAANVLCRRDPGRKTLIGGALFLGLYALFMAMLAVFAPGYIERVWNLSALSGVLLAGIPLEELAFGFAFGMYWAGLYEHFTWRRAAPRGMRAAFTSPGGQHG